MTQEERDKLRAKIAADVDRFKAKGGEIRTVSPDVYDRESRYTMVVERERYKIADFNDLIDARKGR